MTSDTFTHVVGVGAPPANPRENVVFVQGGGVPGDGPGGVLTAANTQFDGNVWIVGEFGPKATFNDNGGNTGISVVSSFPS